MSFNIPHTTPNFSAKARKLEDQLWQASGLEKNTSSTLPLYKDKPYGDGFVARSTQGRRRRNIFYGVLVALLFWAIYTFSRSLDGELSLRDGIKDYEFKGWKGRGKPKTNWVNEQKAVKQAFVDSWNGYQKYAWGKDVYKPQSKTGKNMGPKPLGWFIVDSLDTLMLMGLEKELADARYWVDKDLDYDMDYEVNTFETTIRMLGGLLSAHYLSKDDMYLDKAVNLGNRLLGAFDSETGVPYASVNLKTRKGAKSHADGGASSTAEAATVQLELKYLSKLTGEALYWDAAEKVMKVMEANKAQEGLVPIFIQPDTGKFQGNQIRLGSRGDSYYEYLIKQYLQTEKREEIYRDMYEEAVDGIKHHMVKQSVPGDLAFIGELDRGINGPFSTKMDHLVCFAGGMFALGATEGYTQKEVEQSESWTQTRQVNLRLGVELTRTCYEMYHQTVTGLSPEIVFFNDHNTLSKDFSVKPQDAHNLQRPETVESLFYLWRITRNPIYREWGWEIFQAFEKYTKVPGDAGYDSINNVESTEPSWRNNMESFWLSETLKYLYLLFDDSKDEVLPLTEIVFNTEAHPFPKFDMEPLFTTGWTRAPVQAAPEKVGKVEKVDKEKVEKKVKKKIEKKIEEIPTEKGDFKPAQVPADPIRG
ncbi:Mannosyl-oligosaccharide 1,2-alpha-mannosidase [Yarrowia sp. B02]|nr:Mannosyl-oligosaccharide 1,2-alpha-mannosidase [Yarrowia sp. B02]